MEICLQQGTGDAKCCSSSLRVWGLSQGCRYVDFSLEILGSGLLISELSRAQFKCSLGLQESGATKLFFL